jgi:hypothetical protein
LVSDTSPKAIRERLRRRGKVDDTLSTNCGPDSARRETIDADERDPSRVAPSAEGVTTFAGLPGGVRDWLSRELKIVHRRDVARGDEGHVRPRSGPEQE